MSFFEGVFFEGLPPVGQSDKGIFSFFVGGLGGKIKIC